MTKAERRRQLLRALISDRFDGIAARFADAVGIAPSYVSRMLYADGKAGAKGIGEDSIEKIEAALNIPGYFAGQGTGSAPANQVQKERAIYGSATPPGYVRFDLFEGAAGMGAGVANADYPEVIRTVDVAEWEIRRKLGFLPAPGRMQLMTGRGPSMRPKIEDGDVVMIDTWCTYFDGDDYYLINVDGDAQIKKLMKRADGLWVVSSNPEFPEWRIDPQDLTVCGKALIGLGLRRL